MDHVADKNFSGETPPGLTVVSLPTASLIYKGFAFSSEKHHTF
jgi:hypothetical protein